MYTGINIKEFYFLPTHCIYVSCMDLRKKKKTALISPYNLIWFVFIPVTERLLRGTNSIFKENLN